MNFHETACYDITISLAFFEEKYVVNFHETACYDILIHSFLMNIPSMNNFNRRYNRRHTIAQ